MHYFSRVCNTLLILVLMGILSSAYYQQYVKQGMPCPLCILQRLAMFGVALGAFLNLRRGVSASHYGISLLSAIFGGAVSLRQVALHVCPGFPVFGVPVWGLSLYTWAFLAFAASAFSIAVLLFFCPKEKKIIPMNWFEWTAAIILFALLLSNTITTFEECGMGPCVDLPWHHSRNFNY